MIAGSGNRTKANPEYFKIGDSTHKAAWRKDDGASRDLLQALFPKRTKDAKAAAN